MYTQQQLDELYVANAIAYNQSLRIERIKNLFAIVAAIFTIIGVVWMITIKK